jgi:hypothetical protein
MLTLAVTVERLSVSEGATEAGRCVSSDGGAEGAGDAGNGI